MNLENAETVTPRNLINSKTFSSADRLLLRPRRAVARSSTRPTRSRQLTHERRLSALGPGGLNRKRAGFDVRDVHISHYGRLCPIETPEGTNIGLISLARRSTRARRLRLPDHALPRGQEAASSPTRSSYLRADEEYGNVIAPADAPLDDKGKIVGERVLARKDGDNCEVPPEEVDYMDVSPKQIVGVSAALIPFLEHDDANRALMGSNMQRQAVPLLITEPPIVGTGMEKVVAQQLEHGRVVAKKAGTVELRRRHAHHRSTTTSTACASSAASTSAPARTSARSCTMGEKVKAGQLLADGAATDEGELALGKNLAGRLHDLGRLQLRGRDPASPSAWSRTTSSPRSTSTSSRSRSARPSSARRSSRATSRTSARRPWRNLDENGIVRVGTFVEAGDILVGKVAPKSQERADARGEAAARDLRQGRRGREERLADDAAGHARRRDRRPEVLAPRQPDRRRAHARRWREIRDAEKEFLRALRDYTERDAATTSRRRSAIDDRRRPDRQAGRRSTTRPTYDELRRVATAVPGGRRGARRTRQARRKALAAVHEFQAEDRRQGEREEQDRQPPRRAATSCPPACSRWSRSTSPPSATSRSATRWPAATATRA